MTDDEKSCEQVRSEQVSDIDAVIMAGEAKVQAAHETPLKRKRGRPRKEAPAELDAIPAAAMAAPMAPPPDYAPMIKDIATMGSGALVAQLGTDAAALTEEERERLACGLNPLFQKWFPEIGEMSPEMTAAICCGSVAFAVYLRIKAAERAKAEERAKAS